MLQKRIVVCLDVKDGKVTKGVKFKGNVEVGDPVTLAKRYYEQGVDELVFYDIGASVERRGIMLDVVSQVAKNIFIPFSVGGGIASVEDMHALLCRGAEKISVNSAAVMNSNIIGEGAKQFGAQCIVLGMDVLADESCPSGYRVVIRGGREHTERDALAWAKEAVDRGAGEIVVNSIDADGMRNGYDCKITRLISQSVRVPVVASGGAGEPEHLREVLKEGAADAALVASMVHYETHSIAEIKNYLIEKGLPIRQE